jgi:hypothetical protein
VAGGSACGDEGMGGVFDVAASMGYLHALHLRYAHLALSFLADGAQA